jgi:hypothetical protein
VEISNSVNDLMLASRLFSDRTTRTVTEPELDLPGYDYHRPSAKLGVGVLQYFKKADAGRIDVGGKNRPISDSRKLS